MENKMIKSTNNTDMQLFKMAMEVGYYFENEVNDKRTEEWCGSEDCTTFTKIIVDYAKDNNCDISFAFYELADETIDGIYNGTISVDDHMWDDYCRGFLAGEIIGYPNEENMKLVKKAEKLWKDTSCGYYQDVLNKVKS